MGRPPGVLRDRKDGLKLHSSKPKSANNPRDVPAVVVSRLSLYLRELQHLVRAGRATVSSSQLATLFGFTDAQVRKDLAYFGHFGHPGIGYRCDELIAEIRRIIGASEPAGRRLDFLMQELNREANTLSSKSQDLETTRAAVEMKVTIEQMREQVQNIE